MTKEEFAELHQIVATRAKELMLHEGSHSHTALLGKENELHMVSLAFCKDGGEIQQVLFEVIDSIGPDFIFLIFEGWASMNKLIAPSNDPDRTEVLMISAEHKEYGCTFIEYMVKRDVHGIICDMENINGEVTETQGRLTGILQAARGTGKPIKFSKKPGYAKHYKHPKYTIH